MLSENLPHHLNLPVPPPNVSDLLLKPNLRPTNSMLDNWLSTMEGEAHMDLGVAAKEVNSRQVCGQMRQTRTITAFWMMIFLSSKKIYAKDFWKHRASLTDGLLI
jgi:hypothetical protein